MTPIRAFAHKELQEFVRTWRLWVLVIPFLALAIGGPIFTYYEPQFLESTFEAYGDGQIEIFVPEPTWRDSYLRWAGHLRMIVPLVLFVIAGSAIGAEVAAGSILPILVTGLRRREFVLIKFGVIATIAAITISVGSIINWLVTLLFFPEMHMTGLAAIIVVATLLAWTLIALAFLVSVTIQDVFGSIGMQMVIFLLISLAAYWSPASTFSPVGLLTSITDFAERGEAVWITPAISSGIVTIVLLWMTVTIFERREL